MKKNWKIIWYTLAFIALSFFSIHSVWLRYLSTDEWLNPFFLVFLRFLWWVLFLSIFIPFISKRNDFIKLFKKEKNILKNKNFWLSSIFLFLNLILFIFWTKLSSASNVMLIESLSTIIVWILTVAYYWKKNYSYRTIFYITLVATIGTSMLFSDNSLLSSNSWNNKILGDIFAFIAMIFFAIFSFFYVELRRDFKEANWLLITILFLSVWLILSSPSVLFFYNDIFNISITGAIFIMLVSFGSTWIAYLTWFLAGRYLSAIMLAILFNIVWISTIFVEYLFYWENSTPITYKLYLWTIIILWAVSYMNYIDSKK